MRSAWLFLVPFAVGCSAAPDVATTTSSDLAVTPRYREIERVFNHLDEADVSGCETTFRFLNGNWVDCVVDVEASAFPLEEISHEYLPIRSFSFPTEEPDVSFDVRVEEVTTWTPLPTMRLFVSATYTKVGEVTIHQMPAEHYSYERFVSVVTSSFEKLSHDDTFSTPMFALTGPGFDNPLATDRIVGDLFVARRTVSLDAAACKGNYFDGLTDSWPDPDHWTSYCQVTTPGADRETLPLTPEHWSNRLAKLANTDPIVVRLDEATVTILFGDGGYTIDVAVPDEDASIPWERAEGWISEAIARVHEVTWPSLLKESEIGALLPGEKLEGRLVFRGQKMDVE